MRARDAATIEVEFAMADQQDDISSHRPSRQPVPPRRMLDDDIRIAAPEPKSRPEPQPVLEPALQDAPVDRANSAADGAASSQTVASGGSSSAVLSPEQMYLADVRRILESKKNYPMAARRLGHQGRVLVRFVVDRDGHIREAKITQGSTSDILNRAARSLIESIGGLKPFPSEIRLAEWAVVVPIEYQM